MSPATFLLKDDCDLTQAPRHCRGHLAQSDPDRASVGSEQTGYAAEQGRGTDRPSGAIASSGCSGVTCFRLGSYPAAGYRLKAGVIISVVENLEIILIGRAPGLLVELLGFRSALLRYRLRENIEKSATK